MANRHLVGVKTISGQELLLAPYRITSHKILAGMEIPAITNTDPKRVQKEIARQELIRFLYCYQKHGAIMQPVKLYAGRVIWEVRFPEKVKRWKSGPRAGSAYEAMVKNYLLNNKFPGFSPLSKGDGESFLDESLIEGDSTKGDAQ